MEWPVLSNSLRILLVIIGIALMIIGYFQCLEDSSLFFIATVPASLIFCIGLFSDSEIPYEPPFGKVWFHEWRIKIRLEDIERNEKAVDECKLEIEKRESRIAELERYKQ